MRGPRSPGVLAIERCPRSKVCPTPKPGRSGPGSSPPAPRGREAAHRRPRPSTREGSGRRSSGRELRCRCRRGSRRGAAVRSAGQRAGRSGGGRSAAPASRLWTGRRRSEESTSATTKVTRPRKRTSATRPPLLLVGWLRDHAPSTYASATPPQSLFYSDSCWLHWATQSVRLPCPNPQLAYTEREVL